MPTHKKQRYIYKGELARPLRGDQLPEGKLLLVYAEFDVNTDREAALPLPSSTSLAFSAPGRKHGPIPQVRFAGICKATKSRSTNYRLFMRI